MYSCILEYALGISCHLVSLFSIPFWLCVSNVFVKPSEKYHLDGWIGFPAYFIHLLRILIYIHDTKPLCHRLIDNIIILLDLDEVNDFFN